MQSRLRRLALARTPILTLLAGGDARSDENLFGYSYGSETLPKGSWELYNWMTWRTSKGKGDYDAIDLSQEVEYGITDRLQASFYLNERYHSIRDAAPIEDGEPEYRNRDQFAFQGVQTSVKYNFLSPYDAPLGFSLYFEPGYSRIDKISGEHGTEWEFEAKALFQKNFLDDQLIAVLNITPEVELEKMHGDDEFEKEFLLEFTGGLTYRIAPKWYLGVESRYHSEYPEFDKEWTREHWAVFLGPALHYGSEKWWFTLTVLPQIYGKPQDGDRSHTLHLDEHERVEVRLKTGFNF
jgi:hypothetical protein